MEATLAREYRYYVCILERERGRERKKELIFILKAVAYDNVK
jgi:hypothetical protein